MTKAEHTALSQQNVVRQASNDGNANLRQQGAGQIAGENERCKNQDDGKQAPNNPSANVVRLKLISFHESHGRLATVTAVRPPARFGYMKIENDAVTHFGEKNQSDEGWINGGFFVLEPTVLNVITSPNEPFESGALTHLAKVSQLMAYQHEGFWQPMDTLREKRELEKYASLPRPPWLKTTNP